MKDQSRTILTERTAKRIKAVQGLGFLAAVAGTGWFMWVVADGPLHLQWMKAPAALVLGAGVIAMLVGGVLGWWHHE